MSLLDCPSLFQIDSWRTFNNHRPQAAKLKYNWVETEKSASQNFHFTLPAGLASVYILFQVLECVYKLCSYVEKFYLHLAKKRNSGEQYHLG